MNIEGIRVQTERKIQFCEGLIDYYREHGIDTVADVIQEDIDAARKVLAEDKPKVLELTRVLTALARNKYPWQT